MSLFSFCCRILSARLWGATPNLGRHMLNITFMKLGKFQIPGQINLAPSIWDKEPIKS